MSRDFDDITKNIIKNNKELHNVESSISKEIDNLQKSVKKIENKINSMDETLGKLFEIMNSITVFLDEEDEEEIDDEEDWTPYDDRNFSYEDNDMYEDEWNSHEDES